MSWAEEKARSEAHMRMMVNMSLGEAVKMLERYKKAFPKLFEKNKAIFTSICKQGLCTGTQSASDGPVSIMKMEDLPSAMKTE